MSASAEQFFERLGEVPNPAGLEPLFRLSDLAALNKQRQELSSPQSAWTTFDSDFDSYEAAYSHLHVATIEASLRETVAREGQAVVLIVGTGTKNLLERLVEEITVEHPGENPPIVTISVGLTGAETAEAAIQNGLEKGDFHFHLAGNMGSPAIYDQLQKVLQQLHSLRIIKKPLVNFGITELLGGISTLPSRDKTLTDILHDATDTIKRPTQLSKEEIDEVKSIIAEVDTMGLKAKKAVLEKYAYYLAQRLYGLADENFVFYGELIDDGLATAISWQVDAPTPTVVEGSIGRIYVRRG